MAEKERFLERKTVLPCPINKVFDFFSAAENLNRITPPKLDFSIATPLPIAMGKGTLIDYKIKLMGVSIKWRTLISIWEPPFRFVDCQLRGPYQKWEHEHLFEEKDGNTIMYDRVIYKVPGGPLEPIIHSLFVKNNLEEIFNYREKACGEIFN